MLSYPQVIHKLSTSYPQFCREAICAWAGRFELKKGSYPQFLGFLIINIYINIIIRVRLVWLFFSFVDVWSFKQTSLFWFFI